MGIRSKWLIFLLIIALIAGAVIIFKRGEKQRPVDTPVADSAALMKKFDYVAKLAILHFSLNENEAGLNRLQEARRLWQDLSLAGKDLPIFIAAEKGKVAAGTRIAGHIEQAQVSAGQNNINETLSELGQARVLLKEANGQSGQTDISGELLVLSQEIKKARDAEGKEAVANVLPDLKYHFTGLKQHNFDDRYRRLIRDMENRIAALDRLLDGPDYRRAQSELWDIFLVLYVNY
jgi:hypothetical protein